MAHPLPEQLTSRATILHRAHPRHCDDLYEAVCQSLPELTRWSGWAEDYAPADAATWVAKAWLEWAEGKSHQFIVTHRRIPGVLGVVGLSEISPVRLEANLGYWIRSDMTGQGLATTAARQVAKFAFSHLNLRRIRLFHAIENEASQRVAEKVGFVYEGHIRAHIRLNGVDHDTLLYSLIGLREVT